MNIVYTQDCSYLNHTIIFYYLSPENAGFNDPATDSRIDSGYFDHRQANVKDTYGSQI